MSDSRDYSQSKTSLALHRGRNSIKKIDSSGQFDFHKFSEPSTAVRNASHFNENEKRNTLITYHALGMCESVVLTFITSPGGFCLQCPIHVITLNPKLLWHCTVAETLSKRLIHPGNSISINSARHLRRCAMFLTSMKT